MGNDYLDFDVINYARLARETNNQPMDLDYQVQPTSTEQDENTTRVTLMFIAAGTTLAVPAIYLFHRVVLQPVVLTSTLVLAAVIALLSAVRGDRSTATAVKRFLGVLVLPFLIALLGAASSALAPAELLYLPCAIVTAYIIDRLATHYVYWTLAAPEHGSETRRHWKALWRTRFVPLALLLRPLWLAARLHLPVLFSQEARRTARDADYLRGADSAVLPSGWTPRRLEAANLYLARRKKIQELMAKPKGYLLALYPVALLAPFLAIYLLCTWAGIPAFVAMFLAFLLLVLRTFVKSIPFVQFFDRFRPTRFLLTHLHRRRLLTPVWPGILGWFTYGANLTPVPGAFQSPAGSHLRRQILGAVAIFLLALSTFPLSRFFPVVLALNHEPWDKLMNRPAAQSYAQAYTERDTFVFQGLPDSRKPERRPQESNQVYEKRLKQAEENYFREQARAFQARQPAYAFLLSVDGMMTGEPRFLLGFLCSVLGCLLFPTFAFLLAAGTVLMYLSLVMLSPIQAAGRKDDSSRTLWDCYAERLRLSPNDLDREHFWLGAHAYRDYPVVLHRKLLSEHAYIVGDTGSGKTALGVAPLLVQLIRRPDSGIVILDLKGDNALFQATREESARAGRPFRFFTNELGKPTYTFNPFTQAPTEVLSLNQVCENLLEALNLNHGEGYGRSYFSRVARHWLSRALRQHPHIQSFTALYELVRKREGFADQGEQRDAFELISVIEILAAMDQLNIVPETKTYPKPVLDHAIHMPTLIASNHVAYFWLPSVVESASVREIAKLALYALLTACYQHVRATGRPPQTYLVIDEFQRIASTNFKIILEQARSFGIGAILSNQTMADLDTPDVDLRPTVQTNTRFKQCFSATDLDHQERLITASGEAIDYRFGYRESSAGQTSTSMQEYLRPRLQRNDIIRASDDPFQSIVQVHRGSGYTQLSGFSIPIAVSHMITEAEYRRRSQAPWPAAEPGTIVVTRKPLEPFSTPEQRIEVAKTVEEKITVPPGQRDYGAELRAIHLEQLRQMGLDTAPPTACPPK